MLITILINISLLFFYYKFYSTHRVEYFFGPKPEVDSRLYFSKGGVMTKKFRLENGLLKIGEIAREAGVKESTVRYYTEVGIIEVAETTDTGYRLYDRDETIRRLKAIREVNESKMTLSQIVSQMV